MLTLFCVVVGEGRLFCVEMNHDDTVHELKSSIKAEKVYHFAADVMDLFLAKKNGAWLNADSAKAMALSDCDIDLPLMDPTCLLTDSDLFGSNFRRKDREVHVLVQLPPGFLSSDAYCPKMSVKHLLQSGAVPDDFTQALEQPLGFKIPVTVAKFVARWPDEFILGNAEYGSAVSFFLEQSSYKSPEGDFTSTDYIWLLIFRNVFGCRLRCEQARPSSSRVAPTQPVVVLTTMNVMVGKCAARADDTITYAAASKLTNMPADAYKTFPRGRTSIPVWTTTPTHIELHQLSFVESTKTFHTTYWTSYYVSNADGRVRFLVDVFKLLKWAVSIRTPNASMHLFPGIRTMTRNAHYVTWTTTGLVKEFHADDTEIDMALIQRIYDANLLHVERGRCKDNTVTITSVGQTLGDARVDADLPRAVILAGVRAALDELHSINVAHCEVRVYSVFVLEGQRVILGNVEYCRPADAVPPYYIGAESCKSALELDELQFREFEDELVALGFK